MPAVADPLTPEQAAILHLLDRVERLEAQLAALQKEAPPEDDPRRRWSLFRRLLDGDSS